MASYVCSRCGAPGETGRGGRTKCLDPYRVGPHRITDPPAPKISDDVIIDGDAPIWPEPIIAPYEMTPPTPVASRLTLVRPTLAQAIDATLAEMEPDDAVMGVEMPSGALTESDAQAAFDAEQDGEIVTAIVGKDRRAALEAIRLTLARELRDAVGKDVATIARELRATLTALDSIPDPKGATRVDNIATNARAKLSR